MMARSDTNADSQGEPGKSSAQPSPESEPAQSSAQPANQEGEDTRSAEQAARVAGELEGGEREVLLDRLARLQAEFENARRRAARDQHEFREYALTDAVRSLLPVLDSFDQALQAPDQDYEQFRQGVELIRKQFEDALRRLGLRPVAAAGEVFDPELHHAIEMVDAPEGEGGRVADELQRGYKLRDRLLRPAMVRVARGRKSA